MAPGVVQMLVMVWVVKMVGLMTMVAVADDGMLNAFTLQLLLLLNSLQLSHQLSDESLRRSTAYVWLYKCIRCIFEMCLCIHSNICSEALSYRVPALTRTCRHEHTCVCTQALSIFVISQGFAEMGCKMGLQQKVGLKIP